MSASDDRVDAPPALPAIDARRMRWELGIISEDDLAGVLGATVRALRDRRTKRLGPPWVAVGRIVLYRRASVMAWLEQLEERSPGRDSRVQ